MRRETLRVVRILFAALTALIAAALVTGCFSASCKPMEVHGNSLTCNGGSKGYVWTGTSCIYTSLCNCTGPDCQRLYSTQDACETAHIQCTGKN